MNSYYLNRIKRQPSQFHGLEVISMGFDTWYASNYSVVKSAQFVKIKRELVSMINAAVGRNTKVGDWEWHHVVETNHMAAILASNENLRNIEMLEMPTVLIHKPEHKFFSQNFNNNAFRELSTIPKASKKQFSLLNNSISEKRSTTLNRIDSLKMMYDLMYAKYPALKMIAFNVFDYHKNLF